MRNNELLCFISNAGLGIYLLSFISYLLSSFISLQNILTLIYKKVNIPSAYFFIYVRKYIWYSSKGENFYDSLHYPQPSAPSFGQRGGTKRFFLASRRRKGRICRELRNAAPPRPSRRRQQSGFYANPTKQHGNFVLIFLSNSVEFPVKILYNNNIGFGSPYRYLTLWGASAMLFSERSFFDSVKRCVVPDGGFFCANSCTRFFACGIGSYPCYHRGLWQQSI